MTNLILFLLSVVGMTNIMVGSDLFIWLRDKLYTAIKKFFPEHSESLIVSIDGPLTCHQCMGTWCGFFCGLVFITSNFWEVLGCGFAGSFLVILANQVLELILSKTCFQLPDAKNE